MPVIDARAEIKQFLTSRRERITPERAGLPAYGGGTRRVPGLRREEVALLAGVSVDYYIRMERGGLAGASDGVLDALATALQLDAAERSHLFHLARRAVPYDSARRRRTVAAVRPALQQMLDASTEAPACVLNDRYDLLAANRLGRALYSPMLADSRRPVNVVRFVYLNPDVARAFFVDYDHIALDAAAKLRMAAGRSPQDEDLFALVGELSTRSELFGRRWASQDVRVHRSGRKRLHHPVVGRLDLDVESMDLPADPGLMLNIYTAPAATASAAGLGLLASWGADPAETADEPTSR